MKSKILKLCLIPTIVVPSTALVTNCSIVEHFKNMPKQIDGSDWLGRISGYFVKDDDYEINTEEKTVTYWNMYELKAQNLVVPNYVMWQGEKYKVILDINAFRNCTDTLAGSVELNDFCDVIPTRCFQNDENITKIIFHTYPKEIHEAAFEECSSLNTICVKINDTIHYDWTIKLEKVRAFAFKGCALDCNLIFGPNFKTIEPSAFAECDIRKVDLSMCQEITAIPEDAFAACGLLRQVVFPKTVNKIKARAFSGCDVLEKVILPAQNMEIVEIGELAFSGCVKFRGFFYKEEWEELVLSIKGGGEACFFNNKALEPRDYLINSTFGDYADPDQTLSNRWIRKSMFEGCSFTSWKFAFGHYREDIWGYDIIHSNAFAFNQDLRFLDFTSFGVSEAVPDSWQHDDVETQIETEDVFAHGSKFGTIYVRSGFIAGSSFPSWVAWFKKQGLTFDDSDYTTPSLNNWNFQEREI